MATKTADKRIQGKGSENSAKNVSFCGFHYSWVLIFRILFSKRCTFGSKSSTKSLVRRHQAKFSKTVPEHLKIRHIWLINSENNLCLVIFFIRIIQLSLFSNAYLPIAGKKVNIHY